MSDFPVVPPEPTPPSASMESASPSRRHPCQALQRKHRLDAERIEAMSDEDRNPKDETHWMRRHLKIDQCNLFGDFVDISIRSSTMQVLHAEVIAKIAALARRLGDDLFNSESSVSKSAAIDLAIRWFVQHPPPYDWMYGYVARWFFSHPRGRSVAAMDDPIKNNWAAIEKAGFKSVDEYKVYLERLETDKMRKLMIAMESRELTYEEICPHVDRDWISDGKLKIPKKVKQTLATLPAHDET